MGLDPTKINFKVCGCTNPDYTEYIRAGSDLKIYNNIYENINFPDRCKDFCFEKYKLEIPVEVQSLIDNRYYVDDRGNKKYCLFFWGSPGSGKTILSCSILNSICVEFKLAGRFENTVTTLWPSLKKFYNISHNEKYYSELEYLEDLAKVDILVIDDISSEKTSEWIREKLYYIYETRDVENKITITTSNYHPDALAMKLGDKIVSRMMEYNKCIEFEEVDWRQKEK